MGLILGFIVFFTILLAYMIYTSDSHWGVKAIALAVFLSFDVLAYEHYIRELGAPIQAKPIGEFEYIWHVITGENMFVIWLNNEARGNRLYTYPYNREDAAELEKARQRGLEGQDAVLFFDEGSDGVEVEEFWVPDQNEVKPPEVTRPVTPPAR